MTPIIGVILAINIAAYAGLVLIQGGPNISAQTMAAWGGLLPLQWLGGEYWRFLVAGFLHFGPTHILANSICLLAWGVPMERFFGPLRLAILYLGSILAGACGSILLHDGLFISAGASGGTSGLLGALLVLRLMGRILLPASFFAINFGLNIGIALLAPGIDWQAHLGGCVGGMVIAAMIVTASARRA